jgi:hypothetical protein
MYPNDFQMTFDFPTPTISAERRYITNVPQQRLFFLNNTFVQKQAEELANRVKGEGTEEAQVTKAFQIAYQRVPTADEMKASIQFLHDAAAQSAPVDPAPAPTPASASGPVAKPVGSGSSFETALAIEQQAEQEKAATEKTAAEKPVDKAAAPVKDSPLQSFCWALLSSNEFLFID